jgi:hypothetical protein
MRECPLCKARITDERLYVNHVNVCTGAAGASSTRLLRNVEAD